MTGVRVGCLRLAQLLSLNLGSHLPILYSPQVKSKPKRKVSNPSSEESDRSNDSGLNAALSSDMNL